MKKLLILMAIIFASQITYAQWSAGLNLGAGFPTGDGSEYAKTGFQWDLHGQYLVNDKIGFTASLGSTHFGDGEMGYNYDFGNALAGGRFVGTANFTYQVAITTFTLGANYYFAAPSTGIGYYAGLGIGINNATLKSSAVDEGRWYQNPITYTEYKNNVTFEDSKGSGVGIIPRIGLTYGFSENWMVKAELGYDITGVKMSNEALDDLGLTVKETNFNYVPLLFGIDYRF